MLLQITCVLMFMLISGCCVYSHFTRYLKTIISKMTRAPTHLSFTTSQKYANIYKYVDIYRYHGIYNKSSHIQQLKRVKKNRRLINILPPSLYGK